MHLPVQNFIHDRFRMEWIQQILCTKVSFLNDTNHFRNGCWVDELEAPFKQQNTIAHHRHVFSLFSGEHTILMFQIDFLHQMHIQTRHLCHMFSSLC